MGQMLKQKYRPQTDVKIEKALEDVVDGIVESVELVADGFKKIFGTQNKTKKTEISTAAPYIHSTTYLYGHSVSLAEVKTLKSKLSEYYGQTKVYGVDAAELYDTINDDLVLVLAPYVRFFDGSMSFEEILKYAMDISRRINNPIIKGIDALPGLDNLLETDLIGSDTFGVQRISLAIVWSALILALLSKWTTIMDYEEKRIIKGGIASALSVGVAFIQFCHKSPESITNYLRLLYENYNNVRDKYNKYHAKQIPDILKISSPRSDFARMTSEEKITTGQVLNMVYTFRVGDTAMSILETKSRGFVISDDICKNIIKSIIPIPTQEETKKIYRLYTEDHIYNF